MESLVLCVIRERSRGVKPSVVFLSVISKPRQWGDLGPLGLWSHDKTSLVVTICTTSFNIKNFHFLPIECIYVFGMVLRTTSDISLYSIILLGFITEVECVYCVVRTDALHLFCVHLVLVGLTWLSYRTFIRHVIKPYFCVCIEKVYVEFVNHLLIYCSYECKMSQCSNSYGFESVPVRVVNESKGTSAYYSTGLSFKSRPGNQ